MINSQTISVVVQGAINKTETIKCLKSIRKYLPDAEIILSTWEGSDVTFLENLYDKLVLNKDPGAFIQYAHKNKIIYNNLNRQLLSTQNGLKQATRKYALKLRSDLILKNDNFLKYFDAFQNRTDDYNLFNRKILTSTLFTRYDIKLNENYVPLPFHISDWWFFGLREDLNKYFLDTPLVKEPEFTKYYELEENKNKISPYGDTTFKFAPEQYFGYTPFAQNFSDIYMEDASDISDELFEKFRKCLVNNFIILEYRQSGIYMNKYYYSRNEKMIGENYLSLYTFNRYENEYKSICDKDYNITSQNTTLTDKELYYLSGKIQKHFFILFMPKITLANKLINLFISLPFYLIKFLFKFAICILQKMQKTIFRF